MKLLFIPDITVKRTVSIKRPGSIFLNIEFEKKGTLMQIFRDITVKRPVSIKRPGLSFLKKSLLNDQYDLKNQRSK